MGTRLLPATKSQPKEMLPVGIKPVVQHVVEELVCEGVDKLLFVTGRKKRSIEDHFDDDPELVERFNTCVPVVEIDGVVRFRGRVDGRLLRRFLR